MPEQGLGNSFRCRDRFRGGDRARHAEFFIGKFGDQASQPTRQVISAFAVSAYWVSSIVLAQAPRVGEKDRAGLAWAALLLPWKAPAQATARSRSPGPSLALDDARRIAENVSTRKTIRCFHGRRFEEASKRGIQGIEDQEASCRS
jgi:hypothetical protein